MVQSEQDNLTRWDGHRRGFYEVYYLKVNDPRTDTALWARYTLLAPRDRQDPPVAELWAVFFDRADPTRNVALKRSYPTARMTIGRDPFSFRVGEAVLRHHRAMGGLAGEGGSIAWDLSWEPARETFYHFPRPALYRLGFPKTKVLAPNLSVRMRGAYTVNGVTYHLENAPGHQAHIWGTGQGLRWTWGNCAAFAEDPTAVFEGLSAQVKVGPLPSPALTIYAFCYQGRWYLFNGLSRWLANQSRSQLGSWDIFAQGRGIRFRGRVMSRIEDLVGVAYTDTDGSSLYCHNTKVGDMVLHIYRQERDSWRLADTLTSRGGAAVEWVTRRPDPRVPIRI